MGNIMLQGLPLTGGTVTGETYFTASVHAQIVTDIYQKVAPYQLAASDCNATIECNGTFTITLPDGLPVGFQALIVNVGAGTITLAAATALTSENGATDLSTQYTAAAVYHAGSNVWRAFGGLT